MRRALIQILLALEVLDSPFTHINFLLPEHQAACQVGSYCQLGLTDGPAVLDGISRLAGTCSPTPGTLETHAGCWWMKQALHPPPPRKQRLQSFRAGLSVWAAIWTQTLPLVGGQEPGRDGPFSGSELQVVA